MHACIITINNNNNNNNSATSCGGPTGLDVIVTLLLVRQARLLEGGDGKVKQIGEVDGLRIGVGLRLNAGQRLGAGQRLRVGLRRRP